MSSIGEKIKSLRKELKLTQKDCAKSINVSQGTLSDIEKEKCNPSIDTVISVCQYFGISADWLLTEKGGTSDKNKASFQDQKKAAGEYLQYAAAIGKKIFHVRMQQKLVSKEEFAHIIGITKEELMEYETGEKITPAYILYKISEIFDINPSFLLDPNEKALERLSTFKELTEFEKNFYYFLSKLPQEEWEEIGQIIMMKYKRFSKKGQLSNSTTGEEEQAATEELA